MEFAVLEVLWKLRALSFMEFGAWNVDACRAASVERSGAWEIKKWTSLDCILDVKIDSCRYHGDFAVKRCRKIFAITSQRDNEHEV